MLLTINIYNCKSYSIQTYIEEKESILDFMNKHDILKTVPYKYKCIYL